MARMGAWLRARNVPPADERIQANTYFAATIAGDALAHMDENFSRDYFIERVEHMTEQSLFPSVYPRLSLGPGQRFASRGLMWRIRAGRRTQDRSAERMDRSVVKVKIA